MIAGGLESALLLCWTHYRRRESKLTSPIRSMAFKMGGCGVQFPDCSA